MSHFSSMKKAGIADAVTLAGEDAENERLSRLVRDGLVRLRRMPPPRRLFGDQPPHSKAGASVLDALLAERREGR